MQIYQLNIPSADGVSSNVAEHINGLSTAFVHGDFGSGTITLQCSVFGGDSQWFTVVDVFGVDVAFAEAGYAMYELPAGAKIRWSLSGSTDPSINAKILKNDGRGVCV